MCIYNLYFLKTTYAYKGIFLRKQIKRYTKIDSQRWALLPLSDIQSFFSLYVQITCIFRNWGLATFIYLLFTWYFKLNILCLRFPGRAWGELAAWYPVCGPIVIWENNPLSLDTQLGCEPRSVWDQSPGWLYYPQEPPMGLRLQYLPISLSFSNSISARLALPTAPPWASLQKPRSLVSTHVSLRRYRYTLFRTCTHPLPTWPAWWEGRRLRDLERSGVRGDAI